MDVDLGAICGVRLGDPFENLEALGRAGSFMVGILEFPDEEDRPSGKPERSRYFEYSDLGLRLSCTLENRLNEITVVVRDDDEAGTGPFKGAFRLNGEAVDLSQATSRGAIIERLGQPDHLHPFEPSPDGAEEFCRPLAEDMTYMFGDVLCCVVFDEADGVEFVFLGRMEKPPEPSAPA